MPKNMDLSRPLVQKSKPDSMSLVVIQQIEQSLGLVGGITQRLTSASIATALGPLPPSYHLRR